MNCLPINLTVHPVPTPPSIKDDPNNNNNAGGNNQNEILFNLVNAMSGAPIINGTNQFSIKTIFFNIDWTISSIE